MAAWLSMLALGLAALSVSCASSSPTGSTELPDLRGTWQAPPQEEGTWRWTDDYTYAPGMARWAYCDGAIEVTSQSGASFEGRYLIECAGAGRSAGLLLRGQVQDHGRLTFELRASEGWGPGLIPGWLPPCQLVDDEVTYSGTLTDGLIKVHRFHTMACPQGRVLVGASFLGRR